MIDLSRFQAKIDKGIKVETRPSTTKRQKSHRPFAIVDLAQAAKAALATNCPKLFVWLWLVHKTRTEGETTIPVPNGVFAKYGITRKVKYLALQQLEQAGLIAVEWYPRKSPIVTLL